MIPTTVQLNVSYYQMDKRTKKLISASVDLLGYVEPADLIKSGYMFTLKINYMPLSHTDLAIAFALPWTIYVTMYIVVGSLCVIMVVIFMCYHRFFTRQKNRKLHFWQYINLYLPPNLFGFLYSLVPQFLYILIIAVVISQHLMTFKISSLFCDSQDTTCLSKTFWDVFYLGDELDAKSRSVLQKRRLGYLFIHAGVWIHWRMAQLSTLKSMSQDTKNQPNSFDHNIWDPTSWKRFNYYSLSFLTILLELYFVHLSFSNIFGDNLWYFIAGLKVLGITVENVAEILLSDNLLLSPISSTIGLMENLCTFGAPDFLEFMHSFVLGLGVQMAERAYIEPVVDMVVDYIVGKIADFQAWMKKIMGEGKQEEEDVREEEEDESDEDGAKRKDHDENKSSHDDADDKREKESQCSDILLTENSNLGNEAIDVFEKINNIFVKEEVDQGIVIQPGVKVKTGTSPFDEFDDVVENKAL
jgi:hypothetical protein